MKDRNLKDSLKGINMVKMGNMEEAIQIFSDVVKNAESNPETKPRNIAEAYWNLGLAYEYSWEFDKAIECFIKADDLYSNNKYMEEKKNAEKLKKSRQLLISQGIAK